MGPFRVPPRVELGPLDVGLASAARRAIERIPSGGRLVAARDRGIAPHASGAIGSVGLVAVSVAAFVAATSAWRPRSLGDLLLAVGVIALGGFFLALIMRAVDRAGARSVLRGDRIGRAARRVISRLEDLARQAELEPDLFHGRRLRALRRTLTLAEDPDVARWIPGDVIGRGELLLARAVAARGGACWTASERSCEVKRLLLSASDRLEDPTPAIDDLEELDEAPVSSPAYAART